MAILTNPPLAEVLDGLSHSAAAELMRVEGGRVRCLACGHRCSIGPGQRGICKVRFHDADGLKVPFGYVAGLQCDPVEKKPFFHVYPGSDALTFGMMGCDLHCSYCQNWVTSQALRDPAAITSVRPVSPAELVRVARREGARLAVSSYNEPLITAEWAVAVFEQMKAAGIACAFVSNGNATPEVLDFLRPWIVAYKVDLKTFSDRNYRKLGGVLENITDTIRMIHERGIWLEVVTLVIPGFNDSPEELRNIARFLASVSRDIPWHVTAFHKDYRMTDPDPTSAGTLRLAARIGTEEGLRFVYAGNLPGRVDELENTRCPDCRATVIERVGYLVRSYQITPQGCCPFCETCIPGIWPTSPSDVKTGNSRQAYQGRLPRPLGLAVREPTSMMEDRREGLAVVQQPVRQTGGITMVETNSMSAAAEKQPFRPASLADDQRARLLASVGTLLRGQALGENPILPADVADLASQLVAGAFVSLKRGRHLRACCGSFGSTVSLAEALRHAAERTIWDDERFPPVSLTELPYLDLEIWLLHNPQPVPVRGAERAGAVTIGKHGIQVVRGRSRGLFLPSVALDYRWDAVTFLDRVCMKAGLPASAWKEEDTALFTFEGEVLQGRLADFTPGLDQAMLPATQFSPADVQLLANLCRANLSDMLNGITPRHFVGAVDGRLHGVYLVLQQAGAEEAVSFHSFSPRNAIALQATLFGLVQAAAQHLARRNITPAAFETLNIGLTLLSDPHLHGSVAEPRHEGINPKERGMLVVERNKMGFLFDPGQSAVELVKAAAGQARVSQPETASVMSFRAASNMGRTSVSTAPRPIRGPATRPPAVAGKFYPGDATELARTVDDLLAGDAPRERWAAAMVPHAGLRFSGRVAAGVLKRIEFPRTVIVLGPNHTGRGMEWAVAPQQTWEMPGFRMASDFILARQLCEAIPGLEMDAAAHQFEHAIEVELPLLAKLAPETRVLGIAIAHGDLPGCLRFAKGLAEFMRNQSERPLLLVSSDMNHFASDEQTRLLDALALASLEKGDPAETYACVTGHNISMCGVLPAVIVLETLKTLGTPVHGVRTDYATSADVTGDASRVVGYAGMLFR